MTQAKKLFLLLLCLAIGQVLVAQTTYTTISGGNWDNAATWAGSVAPPNPIPANDIVEVKHIVFSTTAKTNNGTINVQGTNTVYAMLQPIAGFDNYGTIDLQNEFSELRGNGGTINNKSGGIIQGNLVSTWNNTTLNNEVGGLIEIDNQLNVTSQGTNILNNAGTIITNGKFICRGPFTGAAGSSLNLNGSQSSFYNTFMNGGAIKLAGGYFSAGVGGVYTGLADSAVEWILSTNPGAGYPSISYSGGTGDFALSTFTVSLANGFEPSDGDAYSIFSGSPIPTNPISLPALSGGKTWNNNSTSSQIILEVEAAGPITYTTIAPGNWDNPATWDGNGIPPNPIPADATVELKHNVYIPVDKTNNGIINMDGSYFGVNSGLTLTNNGIINLANHFSTGLSVNSGCTVDNYGTITMTTVRIQFFDATFNNKAGGVVETTDGSSVIFQFGSNNTFNNEAGATMNLANGGRFEQYAFSSNNVLNNEGTINNGGSISIYNTFNNKAGGLVDNKGFIASNTYNGSISEIINEGAIKNSKGSLYYGWITISKIFTALPGSSIEWILSTQPSGNNYPYINILSGATVDFAASTFAVSLGAGFEPNTGAVYDIYRGSPVPTNAISLPPLSGGNTWKEYRAPDFNGIRLEVEGEVSCEPTAINCPNNIVENNDNGDCGAIVSFALPDGATATPTSGSFFSLGTTTVNVEGSDGCDGTSTCSFTVTVNDTEKPTFSNCPGNITVSNDTGDCGAEVSWTAPSFSDNCTGASSSSTHDSGDFFAIGTTTVTYSGSDAANNDAIDCSFTVTVNDTEKPSISCTANTTVGTDAGECGADLAIPAPDAGDNCQVAEVKARYRSVDENGNATGSWTSRVSDPSGYFAVGRYQIQWRAVDANGNKKSCAYYLEVEDDEDPVAVCKNVTVNFNGEETISLSASQVWNEAASSDNCAYHYVGTSPSLAIGCDEVGNTVPFTVTISDNAGNTDHCTSYVTVTGLPCGWVEGPQDGSLNCGSNTSADYDTADESFALSADGCLQSGSAADQAAYVYQALCGDGQLTVRLASINNNGYAGLMARESLDPKARRAGILKNYSTIRVRREWRASYGGSVSRTHANERNVKWFRIIRAGNAIKSYTSTNGSSWDLTHKVTFTNLDDCIYLGMMAYSLNGSAEVKAVFDQVSFEGDGGTNSLVDNATLPNTLEIVGAIDPIENGALNIFPNPAKNQVQMVLEGFQDMATQVVVRDPFGRIVRHIKLDSGSDSVLPLDIQNLAAGLYMVSVIQDERIVVSKKLVVQP